MYTYTCMHYYVKCLLSVHFEAMYVHIYMYKACTVSFLYYLKHWSKYNIEFISTRDVVELPKWRSQVILFSSETTTSVLIIQYCTKIHSLIPNLIGLYLSIDSPIRLSIILDLLTSDRTVWLVSFIKSYQYNCSNNFYDFAAIFLIGQYLALQIISYLTPPSGFILNCKRKTISNYLLFPKPQVQDLQLETSLLLSRNETHFIFQ